MRKIFVFLIFNLLIGKPSFAKDVWIQFVGINEYNPVQNHSRFYKSAKDFGIACKMNPERTCESYMNLDATLVDPTNEYQSKEDLKALSKDPDLNRGAISREKALEKIKNILSNAKENDQIVLAMENHGGPVFSPKNGKSCIYLDGFDCISDDDIKQLIKSHPLPSGAKIAIVADGCYSGGFHDLMTDNVCVATTADQYSVGIGPKDKNFWQYISEDKMKKFSDLASFQKSGAKTYRTSQSVYAERKCAEFRKNFSDQNVLNLINEASYSFNLASSSLDLCKQLDPVYSVKNLTYSIEALNAKDICKDEIDKLAYLKKQLKDLKSPCQIHQKLTRILEKKKDELNNLPYFKKFVVDKEKYSNNWKQYDSLSEDQKNAVGYFSLLNTPNQAPEGDILSKLTADQIKQAKILGEQIKVSETEYNNSLKTFNTLIAENKQTTIKDANADLDFFYSCFLNDEGFYEKDPWIQTLNKEAKTHDKKIFTQKDLDKAKKCESSFRF